MPSSQTRSLITWQLQNQICFEFPQIMVFDTSCLNRKTSLKMLILQSYIIHLSPTPLKFGFSPQEYIEWIFFSSLQIIYPGENCKTNLKTQNNLTFFSPTVKYQTSRSYSDSSYRTLYKHFSDIPHTTNTAFHHHQLAFLNLSFLNVKASELRGKEKWHW